MAQSFAADAVMKGNQRVAPLPRAGEPSAGSAGTRARRAKLRRPSQVPVPARPEALPGPGVREALSRPGEPLGGDVRNWMEDKFAADFSDVRIHRDAEASASARALGADAYTAGNRIVFAAAQYDPASASGRHVLAHELAHVIQQRNGQVSGLPTGGGVTVSHPGDSFEQAAENMARETMASPGTPWSATAVRPAAGNAARAGEGRRHPAGFTALRPSAAALPVQRMRGWGDLSGRQRAKIGIGVVTFAVVGVSNLVAAYYDWLAATQQDPGSPGNEAARYSGAWWIGSALAGLLGVMGTVGVDVYDFLVPSPSPGGTVTRGEPGEAERNPQKAEITTGQPPTAVGHQLVRLEQSVAKNAGELKDLVTMLKDLGTRVSEHDELKHPLQQVQEMAQACQKNMDGMRTDINGLRTDLEGTQEEQARHRDKLEQALGALEQLAARLAKVEETVGDTAKKGVPASAPNLEEASKKTE